MKIKFLSGLGPGSARLSQIMVSPTANTLLDEQVSNGKKWVVNWKSNSGKFVIFNNQIKNLDSHWHQLTPAEQDPWNLAAAAIPGSHGCGCENYALNGQKLWRNVNLNLWMRGIGRRHDPPSVTGWLGPDLAIIFNAWSPPWVTQKVVAYYGSPTGTASWLFLSHLTSQLWCYGPTPDTSPWEWYAGDTIYEFCIGFSQETKFRWCTSTDTGLPSQTGIITLGQSR